MLANAEPCSQEEGSNPCICAAKKTEAADCGVFHDEPLCKRVLES